MARNLNFAPAEWYHCFNRGVDKRTIFIDRDDYKRFQMLLYISNGNHPLSLSSLGTDIDIYERNRGERLVDLGVYALMPNHYHLLMRERTEGGITSFMRRVNTGYAMYFNAKYARTGALFSSRFKALHVAKDTYLKRVANYIHANPAELVEHGFKDGKIKNPRQLQEYLCSYEFSSLIDYQGNERIESKVLSTEPLKDTLYKAPSIEGVIEDFNTFYAKSNNRNLWK